jgi:3-dehydroquinate dehydratase-2
MAKNLCLLNGPNLNLSGTREPKVYGSTTLAEIEQAPKAQATAAGATITRFQSNYEGALIDRIHAARAENLDAIPFVRVHSSNIHRRVAFRHRSFLSDVAVGVLCGLGADRYPAAIDFALKKL